MSSLQEMCRLCLSKNKLKPIFSNIKQSEKQIAVLATTTGLKIHPNDGLPQRICKRCSDSVAKSLELRNRCQISELQLLKLGFQRRELIEVKDENGDGGFEDAFFTDFYESDEFKVHLDKIAQEDDEKNEATPGKDQETSVTEQTAPVAEQTTPVAEQTAPVEEQAKIYRIKKSRKEIQKTYLNLIERSFEDETIPKGSVKCKICKNTYCSWTSFKNHAKKHLKPKINTSDPSESMEPGPNTLAKRKTKKQVRQMYMNLVEGEFDPDGPVKCKICKRTYNKWNSFLHHVRKHFGLKFVCEYCGKSFDSTHPLKRHCRSFHGMKRDLKCKHCDYLALDMAQLKVHERRDHTGERPFVCDVCSAAYFRRSCLLQHIESHRTTASVQCAKCPLTFKSRRHLAKHMYGTHSDKRRERRRERREATKTAVVS